MQMTTIEITVADAQKLYGELKKIEKEGIRFPVKTGYWLGRLSAKLESINTAAENQRVALVEAYGKTDAKGTLKVAPEKLQEFTEAYKELTQVVEKVETKLFTFDELPESLPLSFFSAAWPVIIPEDIPVVVNQN